MPAPALCDAIACFLLPCGERGVTIGTGFPARIHLRMSDSSLARLRWRCRRGTKELDVLYGWWLEHRYADADAETRAAFEALLEAQDPDLWDWTIGRGRAPRADWQAIIDDIRARHRL